MKRLAVWSGPRNLSTALMRSFSARPDCVVSDEPFYAAYLTATGIDHPGRQAVLASQSSDWREVARRLSIEAAPHDRPLWYQKHMAQHMREEMIGSWLDRLEHAFLIRHPARVISSYLKVFPAMTLAETGLPFQVRLFDFLREIRATVPVVIDAADLRRSPVAALQRLCAGFQIDWNPAMLRWAPGPHPQDGVWAPHWYAGTWQSTGFEPAPLEEPPLPKPDVPFLQEAVALYERLRSCCSPEILPMTG